MKKLILLLAAVIFFNSCDKKKDDENISTEIEGIWKTDCVKSSTSSTISTYIFSGSNFTSTTNSFSDTACGTKALTSTSGGTFSIGDALASPSGAKKINFVYSSYTMTANSSTVASVFNSSKMCTAIDWTVDTAKDILGKKCGEETVSSGDARYSIYKLDGTKYFAGDTNASTNGKTETARPTEITATPANKQ